MQVTNDQLGLAMSAFMADKQRNVHSLDSCLRAAFEAVDLPPAHDLGVEDVAERWDALRQGGAPPWDYLSPAIARTLAVVVRSFGRVSEEEEC